MKPENHILVIFGASGDLTKKKLLPALYHLYNENQLPNTFAILGVGRKEISDSEFQDFIETSIGEENKNFSQKGYFLSMDTSQSQSYSALFEKLYTIQKDIALEKENYLFYFSTPPSLFMTIAQGLSRFKLNNESNGWKKIIIEKPFGYNLQTAQELNSLLLEYFKEDQIYRIDHYLGKETVQNLLVLRFSNAIFEPLWNRNHIDYIEITSSEHIGIEQRGEYYDHAGAIRDMIQNHLLQIFAFVTMEPPASIDSNSVRNEIVKVLQSVRPFTEKNMEKRLVLGQYTTSHIKGEVAKGYREESHVDSNSKTETFAAMKLFIDNWRWSNVPIFIRTGKRLPTRVTEVAIHFKETPHPVFKKDAPDNSLIIRIQPDEGVLLKFGLKQTGAGFKTQSVNMDFHYEDLSHTKIPEAYERLILDCMKGDATLFARADAVEASWKILSPILQHKESDNVKLFGYPAGSWGPLEADTLIDSGEKWSWRFPCKNLSSDGEFCEL